MKTEELITNAQSNLVDTNQEIIKVANKKFWIATGSLLSAIIFMAIAMFFYDQTLTDNLYLNANYSLLDNSRHVLKRNLSTKEDTLKELKKECKNASDSFDRVFTIRNNIKNPDEKILRSYQIKEQEKYSKCDNLEKYIIYIDDTEKEIKSIITIQNNMKKGLTPVYIFLFLGAVLLLISIFSFISFVNSRQKSLSVRLMINQYHTFHLAAIQCDELYNKEINPKKLIKKILKKIPEEAFKKDQQENSELYTLLGKLKVPQRKSVEARAELIKVISTYHENSNS